MNIFNRLTTSIKTVLIVAVFGLMGSLTFAVTVHAADSMSPMGSCTSTCLNQQNAVAVGGEQTGLKDRKQDKDPEGQHIVPYYVQFQRPQSPRKIVGQNSTLLATFRPPDIVTLNANLRF